MAVKPIPDDTRTVTPHLVVDGAAQAIEFYKKAFGAVELNRLEMGPNKIGYAEIKIGDSKLMLSDEFPAMNVRGPKAYGGTPLILFLYVEDVDVTFVQAIAAGAKSVKPVADQFYGDRSGTLDDPFGHRWSVSTHKEDVSLGEIKKRMAKMGKG